MLKLIWILLLFLCSCSFFDGDDHSSSIELEKTWELVQFIDSHGSETPLNEGEANTLRFANKSSFGGEADCNSYGGEYNADSDGDIRMDNIFATEVACQPPTLGYNFVFALTKVTHFQNQESRLTLFYSNSGKLIFSESLE